MKTGTVHCATWDDFVYTHLVDYRGSHEGMQGGKGTSVHPPLYRGQPDAGWFVETTLERSVNPVPSFERYFQIALGVKSEIESFTGVQLQGVIEDFAAKRDSKGDYVWQNAFGSGIPAYEYLAYLRHHEFPSPLLDWTRSPFIAAFFAFRQEIPMGDDNVAIYALRQHNYRLPDHPDKQRIYVCPRTRTSFHKRHTLQQCDFTVSFNLTYPSVPLVSHQKAMEPDSNIDGCMVTKFTVPKTERRIALAYLNQSNVNSYSLFGSEDALIESLSVRTFHSPLRDRMRTTWDPNI